MINKNTLLITGINKIIEGLTDVKGVLVAENLITAPTVENVAEEVVKKLEPIIESMDDETEEEVVEEEIIEEDTPVVEEDTKVADESEESEEMTERYNDLMELSINEIRQIAKSHGLKAGGSKVSLIESILEFEQTEEIEEDEEEMYIEEPTKEEEVVEETTEDDSTEKEEEEEDEVEEDVEDEEEITFTDEDVAEYKDFLEEEFEIMELKEVAELMELDIPTKITKSKLISMLIKDMANLHNALDEMGCFEDSDDEETEEEEVEDIVEEVEEDVVGDEEEDSEEDEDNSESLIKELGLRDYSQEELADILADYGLSTKGMKTALIDRIVLAVKNGIIEVEDGAPKLLTELEKNNLKGKIADIETERFTNKELTPRAIQQFLRKYYVQDKEYHNYKTMGLTNKDALGLYIKAQQNLLDDYGTRRELKDAYLKDGVFSCCGRELTINGDGTSFCSNCGSTYEVK